MSARLKDLDRLFVHAERMISLLDRCRPLNGAAEHCRLLEAWKLGRSERPTWRYPPIPDLAELISLLERISRDAEQDDAWARLYGSRAYELALEAHAVSCLGSASFRDWAALRFAVDTGEHGRVAEDWAQAWCTDPEAESDVLGDLHASDDESDASSLYSLMLRAVGEARVPFRVLLRRDLPSAAATGDGVILVRASASYGVHDARRIVHHEIHGHVLPRLRAQNEQLGLFATGTAHGADDEEGRALLLEQRAGFLDAPRRAELGRRHLAALAVRQGADWAETVELMLRLGAPLTDAVRLAARAHRGGGLAREVVYLTALSRVGRSLEDDPSLEQWLERGRLSAEAAAVVRRLGPAPETIAIRSAA